MTREQAVALYGTGWWKNKTARQIAMFQLFEELLCMPFGEYHRAVTTALGRAVYNHEFGSVGVARLQKEGPTRSEARRIAKEAKPVRGRPKNFVFRFQPREKSFSLALQFRKASVPKDEIIRALEDILENLRHS